MGSPNQYGANVEKDPICQQERARAIGFHVDSYGNVGGLLETFDDTDDAAERRRFENRCLETRANPAVHDQR